MAIVSNRRHPLDVNSDTRIGLAFPLNKENINNGTKKLKEQIKSNLISVLLTEPNERLYQPTFGVGLRGLLFEPNIDVELLNNRIDKQLKLYVPQILLMNTDTNFVQNENLLYIKIIYQYLLDESLDSIQLNFNNNGI